MTEAIYPVKFLGTLFGDIAHVFLLSDGLKYVVKFKDNNIRLKEVVNEYVVGKLGELLSFPVLPLKLVYISDRWIKNLTNKIRIKPSKAGHQIAVPYIENCVGFPDNKPPTKQNVINRDFLAGMIVFDLWVNNTDRSRTNILLQSLQTGYRFHMIDHGRCFPGGYTWTAKTLKETVQPRMNMPVYKWATSLLNNEEELRQFTRQITSVRDEEIIKVIQSIPEDWNISVRERNALFSFFVEQKKSLPTVVELYIERYLHLIKAGDRQ